jgi:hypothetical protein
MPLYFNKTSRSDCAVLRGFITSNDTFYLDTQAFKVIKLDANSPYYMIAMCKSFEGLINFDDKDWKFEPCVVIFPLHDKKFTRKVKNKDTNQYEEKEETPSIAELAFIQYIHDNCGFDQWMCGEIEFSNSKIAIDYLAAGDHPKIDRLFDITAVTDVMVPTDDIVKFLVDSIASNKSGGKGGYTAKSIQQIFDERFEVSLKALSPYGFGCDNIVTLAFGLKNLKADDPEAYEITMQLLGILLK